jgi:hypothetical protein
VVEAKPYGICKRCDKSKRIHAEDMCWHCWKIVDTEAARQKTKELAEKAREENLIRIAAERRRKHAEQEHRRQLAMLEKKPDRGKWVKLEVGWAPPRGYCDFENDYPRKKGCKNCGYRSDCDALARENSSVHQFNANTG